MKKILLSAIICFIAIMNCNYVEAKEYTKGNFLYEYKMQKEGVWITRITPLSSKGIATLKIPKRLGGRKVVKLGGIVEDGDNETDLFGVRIPEEVSQYHPVNIYKRVLKIKTIRIPSTVKIITENCFMFVPDGKNINIPKGVVENVLYFTNIKWNKLTISPKNKKYKIVDGCLLSKDGKIFYDMVKKRKKLIIPKEVRQISSIAKYDGVKTIVIPKGVNQIDEFALSSQKAVTVKISKENKRYVVKDGSVYSKVTGRLVTGYVKNGVLKVPNQVKSIGKNGYLGPQPRTIIIPESVTNIFSLLYMTEEDKLTCVCKGKTPPKLNGECFGWVKNLILYVPKNCKSKYQEQWKFSPNVKVTIIEQG